jgi:hypothetical protein
MLGAWEQKERGTSVFQVTICEEEAGEYLKDSRTSKQIPLVI